MLRITPERKPIVYITRMTISPPPNFSGTEGMPVIEDEVKQILE